jgi:hypothetical protein
LRRRALVDAGALVRALVLAQPVGAARAVILQHDDLVAGCADDLARVLATATWPESTAAWRSMPVPTIGASGRKSGTAWRCMLEPISARLASSCSRNGINAAETDTICFGETSMYSM